MKRLSDSLGITDAQKTELINCLVAYLKIVKPKYDNKEIDEVGLVNSWLKCVKKPGWVVDKIQNDVEFLGHVHNFMIKNLEHIDMYEMPSCKVEMMDPERRDLELFLYNLVRTKTGEEISWSKLSLMDEKELKSEINRYFYLNNESDTLDDNIFLKI